MLQRCVDFSLRGVFSLPSPRLAVVVEEGQTSVKDAVKGTFGYMAPGNMAKFGKMWHGIVNFGRIMAHLVTFWQEVAKWGDMGQK